MLHAKRGDNLIGDMSIRIIDINITGKTVSTDTILLFIIVYFLSIGLK